MNTKETNACPVGIDKHPPMHNSNSQTKLSNRIIGQISTKLESNTHNLSPDEAVDFYRQTKPAKLPPSIRGETGLPILGNSLKMFNDGYQFVSKMAEKYGPVFRSNLFFHDHIMMVGGDAFQYITEDPDKIFSAALGTEHFIEKMFPNVILSYDFKSHKDQRKVMQPAFKRKALIGYFDLINPLIDQYVTQWETSEDNHIDFYEQSQEMVLSLVVTSLLGLSLGDEIDKVSRAYKDIANGCLALFPIALPGTALRRGLKARAYMVDFLTTLVKKRRLEPSTDMVSLMCTTQDDDGNSMSDQEIIDHILGMIFGAHDTTTSAVNSIIFSLAKNPEWQEVLHDEYSDYSDSYASHDITQELEKTALVFREATRLYPPLATVSRRNIRPFEWQGFSIPENSWVMSSIYFNHVSTEYWTEPFKFDPLRFSDERAEHKAHRYAWCGFGGGAHVCIGARFAELQIKAILFQLIRRYRFSLKPGHERKSKYISVLLPTNGMPVSFVKRQINRG